MQKDWREDAACNGMDPELWFPVSAYPKGAELKRVREAQVVCMSCPVRMQCLEFAVSTMQRGVWGGLTEQQRRRSKLCRRLRAGALASLKGDDFMAMRRQADGIRRARRGSDSPPREYDVFVDEELAGYVERVEGTRAGSAWRAYRAGVWPQTFKGSGAYLAASAWLAGLHRAAKLTNEPVKAAESSSVLVLSPAVADPFRGDPFADPLA